MAWTHADGLRVLDRRNNGGVALLGEEQVSEMGARTSKALPLHGGSTIRGARGAHVLRAQCVYWVYFVDLPTSSAVKCMCFQAVKGIAIAPTALCHLSPVSQFHPCLFHGFLRAPLSPTSDQMVIGCLLRLRVWAVREHQRTKEPRNDLFPIVCCNT